MASVTAAQPLAQIKDTIVLAGAANGKFAERLAAFEAAKQKRTVSV